MNWFGGVMNGDNDAFQLVISTTSSSSTLTLDKENLVNADLDYIWIDWGDGTPYQQVSDIISGSNIDHTYADAGTYIVRTWQQDWDPDNGSTSSFSYENLGNHQLGTNVVTIAINSFGLMNHCSMEYGRRRYGWNWNVWNSDNLSNYPINLTGRLSSFFEDCSHLHEGFLDTPANNERNMNQWFQTQNPTAFQGSFRFNKHFNPLIGKWNMSNVSMMYQSFWECIKFIGIGLQDWDTSNVSNWGMAFEDCYIATFEDIGNWSMAGQSTMSRMFNYCGELNEDISAWGTNDGGMRTSGGADFYAMLNYTAMSVENYSKWIICLANWAYDNSYTTAENCGGNGLSYNSTTYNGIGSGQYTDATAAATYLEGLGWTIGGTDLG